MKMKDIVVGQEYAAAPPNAASYQGPPDRVRIVAVGVHGTVSGIWRSTVSERPSYVEVEVVDPRPSGGGNHVNFRNKTRVIKSTGKIYVEPVLSRQGPPETERVYRILCGWIQRSWKEQVKINERKKTADTLREVNKKDHEIRSVAAVETLRQHFSLPPGAISIETTRWGTTSLKIDLDDAEKIVEALNSSYPSWG